MEILIDGKKVKSGEGKTILEVALENGIEIPHLCWHPALEPYGACRLCLVEVEDNNRKTLVASCTYPVRDGLKVFTNTEKVFQSRRFVIKLLLGNAPDSEKIKKLAKDYEVSLSSSIALFPADNCIRCGLCVRVCRELIKKESIGFIKRGIERIPETPFLEENPECLACGACAYLCPTGRIKILDGEGTRKIELWRRKEKLAVCKNCGKNFVPLKQIEEVKAKIENEELKEFLELCPECRRKILFSKLKKGEMVEQN